MPASVTLVQDQPVAAASLPMYVEGGWKPPWEPPPRPRLTKREELVLLWVLGGFVALLFIAPIGGATLIEAVIAALR